MQVHRLRATDNLTKNKSKKLHILFFPSLLQNGWLIWQKMLYEFCSFVRAIHAPDCTAFEDAAIVQTMEDRQRTNNKTKYKWEASKVKLMNY